MVGFEDRDSHELRNSWPLEAESDPQLTGSKEKGPQFYNFKQLNFN